MTENLSLRSDGPLVLNKRRTSFYNRVKKEDVTAQSFSSIAIGLNMVPRERQLLLRLQPRPSLAISSEGNIQNEMVAEKNHLVADKECCDGCAYRTIEKDAHALGVVREVMW